MWERLSFGKRVLRKKFKSASDKEVGLDLEKVCERSLKITTTFKKSSSEKIIKWAPIKNKVAIKGDSEHKKLPLIRKSATKKVHLR